MLFDPKWEVQTKPDVFSLEGLIAWLEKQPAGECYSYTCNGDCLLAQYFQQAGFRDVHMFGSGFVHGRGKIPGTMGQDEAIEAGWLTRLPKHFNRIAVVSPHTFGAALARARSVA